MMLHTTKWLQTISVKLKQEAPHISPPRENYMYMGQTICIWGELYVFVECFVLVHVTLGRFTTIELFGIYILLGFWRKFNAL